MNHFFKTFHSSLLFTLVFLNSTLSFAQQSLLFEVQHPKQKHSSYVFGTMHVTNEKVFQFNDRVYQAIDKCENALFELDFTLSSKSQILEEAAQKFGEKIKKDNAFSNNFTEYLLENVLPELMESLSSESLADTIFSKLLIISEFTNYLFKSEGRIDIMDEHLQNYALFSQKNVVGLESSSEQLQAILNILNISDAESFAQTIKKFIFMRNEEFKSLFSGSDQSLLNTYTQYSLTELCNIMDQAFNNTDLLQQKVFTELLVNRNNIQFQRSLPYFQEKPTFMAVGAAHLCGENGILTQLKKAGFRIRPVDISSPFQKSLEFKIIETPDYLEGNLFTKIKVPKNGIDMLKVDHDVFGHNDVHSRNGDISFFTIQPLGKASLTLISNYFIENDDEDIVMEDVTFDTFSDGSSKSGTGTIHGIYEPYQTDISLKKPQNPNDEDILEEGEYFLTPNIKIHEDVDSLYTINDDPFQYDLEQEELDDEIAQGVMKNKKHKDIDALNNDDEEKASKNKELTENQTIYLNKVSQRLQNLVYNNPEIRSYMKYGNREYQELDPLILLHKSGKEMVIEISKNKNVYNFYCPFELDYGVFELIIKGDRSFLYSGQLNAFFTDFEVIEKD